MGNNLLEKLLEDAYRAGLYTDIRDIQGDSWTVWKTYNEDRIKKISSKLVEETINNVSPIDDWEDISTAPINIWLVCRNANKRVFEAMKCSTLKSYCWVDRAKLLREPKQWNRVLSTPEIENYGENKHE